MQRYLADPIAELLDLFEVGIDGLAVMQAQRRDCPVQNVWLDVCRVFPINSIGQADLPSFEVLPQHLGAVWRTKRFRLKPIRPFHHVPVAGCGLPTGSQLAISLPMVY